MTAMADMNAVQVIGQKQDHSTHKHISGRRIGYMAVIATAQ
jgi:hypothetical protein